LSADRRRSRVAAGLAAGVAFALSGLMLYQAALLRDVSLRHIEWTENEVGDRVSMATWRFWEDL
jgi:hypothetical protein